MDKTKNFVSGQVITAPSPATSGTTLVVSNGSLFPDPASFGAYNVCVWSQASDPIPGSTVEIVRVTAKSTSGSNASLTITRAQESTTALSLQTGWKVYYSVTQKYFDDLQTAITALQTGKQDTLTLDDAPQASSNNPVKSSGIYQALSGKQNILEFDNVPTDGSSNPVTSNGVANAIADVQTSVNGKQDKLTFDQAPTNASTNPVTSNGVYQALAGKQNSLTFDSTPTQLSDNPVKSGGVYSALAGKQDTLTFDSTPIAGSTNPVTSGGIKTALDAKGAGTITKVQANGTDVASSGTANIPAATTSVYGVTQLTNSYSSTSTTTAATPAAVKAAYDLASSNSYSAGTNININNGTISATNLYWGTVSSHEYDSFIINSPGFALSTGVMIAFVLPDAYTSYGINTINVNSTGYKGVYWQSSTTVNHNFLQKGVTVILMYDGTYFRPLMGVNFAGTITGVSANGTSVATSGVANIPAATTSSYGVTQLSSSTSSTSTTLAATASAVKSAYDLANNTTVITATISSSTTSQSVTQSTRRFYWTQTASSCTYTLTPSQAGLIWCIKIDKTNGYTVAFSSSVTLDQEIDATWTTCTIVFIAWTTSSIQGFVIAGE